MVMLFCRVPFQPTLLFVPIVLVQLYFFCLGVGMLLAAANVFFRDIQYIYNAMTTAWMYLTPIFYPIDQLPEGLRWEISTFNPMFFYISQFRDVVLIGQLPEPKILLAGLITALLAMIIGNFVFIKTKDQFILYI